MGQCFFPRSSARNQVLAAPGAPEERTARAAWRGHQQRRHSHRTGDWSYSFLSSSLIGLQLYFLFFYWSATLFPLRWLVASSLIGPQLFSSSLIGPQLSFPLLWLVAFLSSFSVFSQRVWCLFSYCICPRFFYFALIGCCFLLIVEFLMPKLSLLFSHWLQILFPLVRLFYPCLRLATVFLASSLIVLCFISPLFWRVTY